MNTHRSTTERSTLVLALGLAIGLAGCGPQTPSAPTAMAAPAPLVGQPVPPVQNGQQPQQYPQQALAQQQPQPQPQQYAQAQQQPQQYAPQPAPQQYAQPQPQYAPAQQYAQAPQQPQYAPPPPQYTPAPAPAPRQAPRPAASATLGEIEHIEPIRTRPQGSGVGAVIGGVLGGVVGNQFGHGNGKAAMTVLGAGGGAVAGHNLERNYKEGVSGYRVSVRMDNGTTHVYEESSIGGLRIGDRVRVSNGRIRPA